MPESFEKELIVLAADKSIKLAIETLVGQRHQSLGIRPLPEGAWDVVVQANYDSSILLAGHELSRSQTRRYRRAVMICDRHGCGREHLSRVELEDQMEDQLRRSGWEDRARAVVIDPELEAWVWVVSPHVEEVLGWRGRQPSLMEWLETSGHLAAGQRKPPRPQAALESALQAVRKRKSSALFRQLAERVTLERCLDPAFKKLKATLLEWFPRQ